MTPHRSERGTALIGVIIVLALLMSLAATLAVSVNSDTQMRGAFGESVSGFYAAEAGLNKGMGEYKNIFLDYGVPHGDDFAEKTLTVGSRTVKYQLSERPGNPTSVTIPSGEQFAGLNALQYTYTVNSRAYPDPALANVEASVGAEFLVGYIPLFQFMAFYARDLEIAPGPQMDLQGRVHTNADLYLNADSGPLNIADNPAAGVFTVQVSAGGDIYRGRKRESQCQGTVNVDMLRDTVAPFGNLDPRTLPCNGSGTRLVPKSEIAQWMGGMLSDEKNISIPDPGIIDRGSGVYWQKADLRVVLNLNNAPPTIEVEDVDGNADAALTAQLQAFMTDEAWNRGWVGGRGPSTYPGTYPVFYTDVPTLCNNNNSAVCYSPPFSSDSRVYTSNAFARDKVGGVLVPDFRRGGFYNQREARWMTLLNINVRDLLLWNQQNGAPFFEPDDNSEGGLVIFATVVGPNSNGINNYGVRIFGSADLPIPGGINVSADPTGLTVVSDQAVYVIGDYNRGPIAVGALPRQPAALIGDSINVLSNNYWHAICPDPCSYNDSQSGLGLGNALRNATTTNINAAFLGGVDDTPPGFVGNYNGGLENYPRFHESWSGQTLNYQGSFVSLGTPNHVNGPWCGTSTPCNIYNPPVRAWNYDPAFNDAANLPPLTPRFVYVQQVLFTEDFK
jgi:hypothetical protein